MLASPSMVAALWPRAGARSDDAIVAKLAQGAFAMAHAADRSGTRELGEVSECGLVRESWVRRDVLLA